MTPIPREISELILAGNLIVCPNQSILKALKQTFKPDTLNRFGHPIRIGTLESWAKYNLEKIHPELTVLNKTETVDVFHSIIKENSDELSIADTFNLALSASDAIKKLQENKVQLKQLKPDTDESKAFLKWATKFEEISLNNGSISIDRCFELLIEEINSGTLLLPKHFHTYGFKTPTKLEKSLLDCISNHTNLVLKNEQNLCISTPLQSRCNSHSEEVKRAIEFSKNAINRDPNITICLTSPILNELQNEIAYQIVKAFGIKGQVANDLCNLGVSTPLFETPEIKTLELLIRAENGHELSKLELDFVKSSKCTYSPQPLIDASNAHDVETEDVFIDFDLFETPDVTTNYNVFEDYESYLTNPSEPDATHFENIQYAEQFSIDGDTDNENEDSLAYEHHLTWETTSAKSYEEHGNSIKRLIIKHGWCLSDSNRHKQLFQALSESINRVGKSSKQLPINDILFDQYLAKLATVLKNTPFTLNTDLKQNISVLCINDTLGRNFDHIWILGTNADYWPLKSTSNKLIPHQTALESGLVPKNQQHTDIFDETTNRLKNSCYEMYFSYATYADEKELLPPVFLNENLELHLPKNDEAFLPSTRIESEAIDDTYGTQLEDNTNCPRGTRYVELFNNCPFMSHYLCRFKTLSNINDKAFSENKAHGDLVHNFLEAFWTQHSHSKDVLKYSDTTLRIKVESLLEKTITDYKQHNSLPDWFFDNELIRLSTIMFEFLKMESNRNFKVESIEKKVKLTLENLHFTLFIDRQETETVEVNGKTIELKILSDHKTGNEKPNEWLKRPCPKPQLPIYSLIEESDGTIFNIIRDDEIAYKGIVANNHGSQFEVLSPRGTVDWVTQKKIWEEDITNSVRELKIGTSTPTPRDQDTCKFCTLKRVCRLNENT